MGIASSKTASEEEVLNAQFVVNTNLKYLKKAKWLPG